MSFKPMFATDVKFDQLDSLMYPLHVSTKLEGVRCQITPDGILTRNLKPFGNLLVEERFSELSYIAKCMNIYIEGEIYKHGVEFTEINSCTRKANKDSIYDLELHMFDCFSPDNPNTPFQERLKWLKYILDQQLTESNHYKIAEGGIVATPDEVKDSYNYAIGQGYEGLIVKDLNCGYKHGRSTVKQRQFLRIKPTITLDGIILDVVERQKNLCEAEVNELGYQKRRQDKDMKEGTGMAQTLVVLVPELGKDVIMRPQLTNGLKDADRKEIFENRDDYIGKHVQFIAMEVPGDHLPRSPRFDKWREDKDDVSYAIHDESDSAIIAYHKDNFDKLVASDLSVQECSREIFAHWVKQGYVVSVM